MLNLLNGIPNAELIAASRKHAGVSQVAAADAMGVSRTTWQSWESGYANMPLAAWALWQLAVATHPIYSADCGGPQLDKNG